MVHIVIVVVDGRNDRLLNSIPDPLRHDEETEVFTDTAQKDHKGKRDGDNQRKGNAPAVPDCLLESTHFQYTSLFPVASERRVIGKLPNPAKRPRLVS